MITSLFGKYKLFLQLKQLKTKVWLEDEINFAIVLQQLNVSHDWPLLCTVIIHSHCVTTDWNTLKFLFLFLIPICFPILTNFLITSNSKRSSYSHVLPIYIQQGSSSHFLGFSLIPCYSHSKWLQHDQYDSEQLRAEQNRKEENP